MFYLLIDRLGLSGAAAVFIALAVLRLLVQRRPAWIWRLSGAAILIGFLALVGFAGDVRLFKLYPVAINTALLGYGIYTLYRPPSAIQRMMQALNVPVSKAGVRYTRRVTVMWCGYFALNAAAAGYTAIVSPMHVWAVYNGAVSYAIAALLFGGELVFRGWYKRQVATRAQDAQPL